MIARRLAFLAGESVGEVAAVIGEQLDDLHRCRPPQTVEEVHAAVFVLIGIDVHEDPTRGAVDAHEQIAPVAFIRHLRQVLDVHVHKAWLVVFEGLELSNHRNQVVKRQQRHAAQLHCDGFLRRRQRRVELCGRCERPSGGLSFPWLGKVPSFYGVYDHTRLHS